MDRSILFLTLLVLAQGCVVSREGPVLSQFPPAQGPHGIQATVSVVTTGSSVGTQFPGELLEVTDRGLWLLVDGQVSELGWEIIRWATFTDVRVTWQRGLAPSQEDRRRLTLLSRYPPGLTHEQRARLLEAHGQSEPIRYGEAPPGGGEGRSGSDRDGTAHAHPFQFHGPHGGADPFQDPEVIRWLERTQAILEGFRDQERAILAGYRPLGPDFPGMGVHWLNPQLLHQREPNPRRPPVLTYLDTPSGTVLTGAAFVMILAPGERPPDFPFPGSWHDHSGTVDEEALALNPAAALHPDENEPRVTMLHTWTGVDNPDGIFAQDNWAIPFVRLGLAVPSRPGPSAGKALYLASGGDIYYEGLMRTLSPLSPEEERGLKRVLAGARTRVEELLESLGPEGTGPEVEALIGDLEDVWLDLWLEIRGAVDPGTWERVGLLGMASLPIPSPVAGGVP